MSDSKKETLSLSRETRPLGLRRSVESAQVKQNFSHGRSKTVQVEVRKKRTAGRAAPPPPPPPPVEETAPPALEPAEVQPAPVVEEDGEPRIRHVLPTLSEAEKATRARALEDARRADEAARHQAEEQARLRQMEERRAHAEREAAELRRKAEEDRKRIEEEARRRAEEEAERKLREQQERDDDGTEATAPATSQRPVGRTLVEREAAMESEGGLRSRRAPGRKTPGPRRGEPRRRAGRLTIAQALDVDETDERVRSLASVRRERERQRQLRAEWAASGTTQKIVREVVIPDTITVQELSNRMAERATDVIRALMRLGMMVTVTQSIDADTAELLVNEFGHRPKRVSAADVEIGLEGVDDAEEDLASRPPVVTVMGHVDHGKTSLLDALRKTDVAAREAGGITQHIGAYQVETPSGGRITFLDTPGHEAFTAMRARGAKATDIVVLVVAADDGVMPQTIEAINHAKAAEVPLIVAINKIDRPDADPSRVKRELLQHEVVPEEMGGDVQTVEVSATVGTNLDKLDEAILLQAELLELKANPERAAEGVIVEAKLDRGRGPVATVLVQRGTLRQGDVFVAGTEWGRVRALIDSHGEAIDTAGPSVPVEILGLNGTPYAGDSFIVVENETRAREVADYRKQTVRDERVAADSRGNLQQMFAQIQGGELKEVPVVIKADVQGSLEAIIGALEKLSTDEVAVRVLHGGVGGITESDVTLANASKATIIGFNVRANAQARDAAQRTGIEIRYYQIIYELVDDIRAALSGLLAPERREEVIGSAEVLEVFSITKFGRIAGCRVTSGLVRRTARVRLLRDDVVVHDGQLRSLRRFKDDVREVREGNECGIALENYQDFRPGDVLEFYTVEEIQRTL